MLYSRLLLDIKRSILLTLARLGGGRGAEVEEEEE